MPRMVVACHHCGWWGTSHYTEGRLGNCPKCQEASLYRPIEVVERLQEILKTSSPSLVPDLYGKAAKAAQELVAAGHDPAQNLHAWPYWYAAELLVDLMETVPGWWGTTDYRWREKYQPRAPATEGPAQ